MGIFSKKKPAAPPPSRPILDEPRFRGLLKQISHRLAFQRTNALTTISSGREGAAKALEPPSDYARAAHRIAPALRARRQLNAFDALATAAAALVALVRPLAADSLFALSPVVQRHLCTVLAAGDAPPITPECAAAAGIIRDYFGENQISSFRAAVQPEPGISADRWDAEPEEGEVRAALEEVCVDFGTSVPKALKTSIADDVPDAPQAPMAATSPAKRHSGGGMDGRFLGSPLSQNANSSPFQLPHIEKRTSAEPQFPALNVEEAPMPPPVIWEKAPVVNEKHVPAGALAMRGKTGQADRPRTERPTVPPVENRPRSFQRRVSPEFLESSRAVSQQRSPASPVLALSSPVRALSSPIRALSSPVRASPKQFIPFSASQSSLSEGIEDENDSGESDEETDQRDEYESEDEDASAEPMSTPSPRKTRGKPLYEDLVDVDEMMMTPSPNRDRKGRGRKNELSLSPLSSRYSSVQSPNLSAHARLSNGQPLSVRRGHQDSVPFVDNDAMLLIRYRELMMSR